MLIDDTGNLRIAAAKGLPDQVVLETRVAQGDGIAGMVLATRQPLVVEDLTGGSDRSRRHGIRTAVSVPIADDQGVVGVLNVGAREFSARFSRSHMDALESLGMIGAVALRNAEASTSSRDLYFDTLKALALALETKDPYSRGTTEKVLNLATELGRSLGLEPRPLQALRVAALLHDVGMAAVGDAAAVGNRPLSTVEWGLLKMHPAIAAEVIASAPSLLDAVPIVYHHHERFGGGGYVSGLAGEDIPCGARILSVADAYTAMTSDRPYRRARTQAEAMSEIEAESGSQFDPRVVDALVEVLDRGLVAAAPTD
jgi:HD-GYP domain-containing protein (c-di-GMP phosphodiesterase class II)